MKKVMVVAPHPDDETLGCGGTLLRHAQRGDETFWLICSQMTEAQGYIREKIENRLTIIQKTAVAYGFKKYFQLEYATTTLDVVPQKDMVEVISDLFSKVRPDTLYLPFSGDIHSDHRVVFGAAVASSKWFRSPFVKTILSYETLSETGMCFGNFRESFAPNYYVSIEKFLEQKIKIMNYYTDEVAETPFPRSEEGVRALAVYRGGQAGYKAAEAFMLIKQIET